MQIYEETIRYLQYICNLLSVRPADEGVQEEQKMEEGEQEMESPQPKKKRPTPVEGRYLIYFLSCK